MKPQINTLKKSPLARVHEREGAQMTEFADWLLPLQFSSVLDEHRATREAATLFDISHMGEIEIRGAHALPFLQHLLTSDLEPLTPNRTRYAALCYEHGGTIDDCFVYCFNRNRYWLVVNAANIVKDVTWLRDHASRYSVTIRDLSAETAKIDIQGPLAVDIASRIGAFPFAMLARFDIVEVRMAEVPVVVSRSGYTGEDGLEIYMETAYAERIWNALRECDRRLIPAGLGARDSLRVEACYSLYGHELSEHISPVEAGIAWVVNHRKQEDFVGKNILLQQKKDGTARSLYVFVMDGRAMPRSGYEIRVGGEQAGWVSSGSFSPHLGASVGMGFIENRKLAPGDRIDVMIRDRAHPARIVKRPFYPFKGGRP